MIYNKALYSIRARKKARKKEDQTESKQEASQKSNGKGVREYLHMRGKERGSRD
jgi:hypothetical protein